MTLRTDWLGPGSLAEIGGLISRLNPAKVMLVTGIASYFRSGAQPLVEAALIGREVARLTAVSTNPKIEDIARGVALFQELCPALVVAVGGGSVLDTAKLISLLGASEGSWEAILFGNASPGTDGVPLIAVPTTAGSGAEATSFATFYVEGVKHSLSDPRLRPIYAIVDPLLTASVPAHVAAASGLDALAQAVESLWAVGASAESQEFAEAAVRCILPSLRAAVRAPTPQVREHMTLGAHLAGKAIDISRTTAAHALSYGLTSDLDVAHGHAVALVLPAIFRINCRPEGREIRNPRGPAYVTATVNRVCGLLGCRDGESAARLVESLIAELGLASHLAHDAGVSNVVANLASKVNIERLNNNPVAITKSDIGEVYAQLLQRKPLGAAA